MKKSIALPALLLLFTALLFGAAGCNTAQGFGKDLEALGEKIQGKSE